MAGHANKVIAFDLGISPRTVEIYRANVMTKMKAASLSELVRMAMLAERGPLTVGELVQAAGVGRRQIFALAIVWMCKLGFLDWSAT